MRNPTITPFVPPAEQREQRAERTAISDKAKMEYINDLLRPVWLLLILLRLTFFLLFFVDPWVEADRGELIVLRWIPPALVVGVLPLFVNVSECCMCFLSGANTFVNGRASVARTSLPPNYLANFGPIPNEN